MPSSARTSWLLLEFWRGRAASLQVAAVVTLLVLLGVTLLLAFRNGAYAPGDWLLPLIALAAFSIMLIGAGSSLRGGGRVPKFILGLFLAQTAWTAASLLWAESLGNAWEETNRTLLFFLTAGLAFTAVRWLGNRGPRWLTLLMAATVGVVALAIVIRLATFPDVADLFPGGRLNYPITYFNALAAFLMLGFWLALGLSNASGAPRRERRDRALPGWAQAVLLVLAGFLFELALLPQSRGAFWTFFLTVPFFVALSPHRFRALVDLGMVCLPLVIFWDRLNGVYAAFQHDAAIGPAVRAALAGMAYSALIVVALWVVSWAVERRVGPLSARLRVGLGVTLAVVALAGAAGGLLWVDHLSGGLGDYVSQRWTEVTADGTGPQGGSRFSQMGLNGRLRQWEVAVDAFQEHPVLGVGAQNFEIYWNQYRQSPLDVRQPHSQPMQLLSELGLPGLAIWVAVVGLVLIWGGIRRFRATSRSQQAVVAAIVTALISWVIHSSADWLWQLAALSLPVMMLFGGLAGLAPEGRRSEDGAVSARLVEQRLPGFASSLRRFGRPALAGIAVAALVSATLPYLSLRYADRAVAMETRQAGGGMSLFRMASRLDPTATTPYVLRAGTHRAAAARAPEGSLARIGELEQVAQAWDESVGVDPASWVLHLKAAEALLAVHESYVKLGASGGDESLSRARKYLSEAHCLNPLSPEIHALERRMMVAIGH